MDLTEGIQKVSRKTALCGDLEGAPVIVEKLNVTLLSTGDVDCGVQDLIKQTVQVSLLHKPHADLMQPRHVCEFRFQLLAGGAKFRFCPSSSSDIAVGFQYEHRAVFVSHELVPGGDEDFPSFLGNVTDLTFPKPAFAQPCLDSIPRIGAARLKKFMRSLSERFFLLESVEQGGALVPKLDSAWLPPNENGVEREIDQAGLLLQGFFSPLSLRDIHQHE